ncbi:Athe_2463 domain-containing protein [Ruminiclostridium papyrosolvens]|uniref:Transcriptional regulator n=1 Tax=Ruminiclostridium papyrosolvens C7 TaxID=1330534 RepID=U4R2W5_9FIRM|nr:transcriptional regulator [Ruminiclostridium papyrosolvens]EPR11944.1 transcriptional regulator [Ruminiclostridium papyrosolvens C7]
MNNRLVKVLCMIMCTAFFIAFFPVIFKINATGSYTSLKYEKGGIEFFDRTTYDSYKKNNQLPTLPGGGAVPFSIKKGTNTYYLNYRMFTQKNLVVYGSYKCVAGNYFKCGYQIHSDLDNKQPDIYYDGGYFLKPNGITCKGKEQNPETHGDTCKTNRGEWKYLGFDVNGEVFSNMWMINVATETSFKERNWVKEPWSASNEVKKALTAKISTYNDGAYNINNRYQRTIVQSLRNWMFRTFSSVNGFKGIPNGNNVYDPNVYQYLYVQSAPTIQYSGSGKMWHIRPNGSIWYQTFSIPILKNNKYDLPIKCYVTLASPLPSIPENGEMDKQKVKLQFTVQGVLEDSDYYKDPVTRSAFYTRQDIKNWELNLDKIPGLTLTDEQKKAVTIVPKSAADNQGTATITIETTVADIKKLPKSGDKYLLAVEATAKVVYKDTHTQTAEGNNKFLTNNFKALAKKESLVIDIPTLEIHNHIGEVAFDTVLFRDATDNTDMSAVKSTELYVNGEAVDYDQFFSGYYIFPATSDKNGYFAEVICRYILDKSKIVLTGIPEDKKQEILGAAVVEYVSTDYVYVYPTKPIAQFKLSSNSWKQNRIINVENISADGNIQLVLDKYPIVEYRWSYGGTSQLYKGTDSDLKKQLQYKEPGSYSLTLECKNTLGKWSDPYTVEFQVLEDIAPNIELNLSDSIVTRNDQISAWHYDVNSTDGDKIASARIELWYDSDDNGSVDTLIQRWNGLSDFPEYSPTQLGYYKFYIYAQDEFVGVNGQDTLSQYVTESDKKSASLECDFWVDNYQPLSDIYVDAPVERPNVDLYIMRDKDLAQDKYEYIASNRVTMENALLGRNIIPNVNIWDMKTYEYSTPASISSNTGTNYPSEEISFTSAGYSGKLQRTSVTDNGGYHDFGHYETRIETKTISSGGGYASGHGYGGSTPSSSISYSDGEGYSGNMYIQNYTYTSTPCGHPINPTHGEGYFNWTRSWSGYSGTAKRTVSYWVPNMQWVANYTGYYSGTIYKYVRQPYTDTWRGKSSKYIIYISDGNISDISDFNSVLAKTDAKVILAGTPAILKQYPDCAKYIDSTSKTVQEILNEALEYISEETPEIEQIFILQNQQFTLNVGEDDLEKDEIVSREMQYVHDKDYFDNPTGQESGTQTVLNADSGWKDDIKNSFSNVGKYRIYRRVKDKPSGAYGDNYSYYSGATEVDIYVHRKPVAKAVLDWDFDGVTNTYKTTWKDLSYDLDHNITRAKTDKGISDRRIMWKKEGGEWNYTIPDNLSPGTYRIRYYVKDIENTWSDVFTMDINGTTYTDVPEASFTLSDTPPMQFEAKLRALKTVFRNPTSPVTLPASEDLEVFDLWTRYPSNPYLTMALYNLSGTQVSGIKNIGYSTDTGVKSGNDISWNSIPYNIPDTLIDGNYFFKITANAEQSKTIAFPVTVKTPINLKGYINGKEAAAQINTGDTNVFKFTTSQYVSKTQLLFEGHTYTSDSGNIKLISDSGSVKTWEFRLDITDGAYPDGKFGSAEFKAWLPSGMSETINVDYKFVGIKGYGFAVTMMLDLGWRSYYFDTSKGIDDNRDGKIDRYPRRNNTDIPAIKMPINYFSLVGHSRTYIKAGYKVKGRIDIQGEPDYAAFRIHYIIKGETHTDTVKLTRTSGNTYTFEWVIPLETDDKTFVSFDLVTKKGASTYGSEKWIDTWDSRNTSRLVFYVRGKATDDLIYVQSQ